MLLYILSGVFTEDLRLSHKRILEQGSGANHTDIQIKIVSGRQNKTQVQRSRGRSILNQTEERAKMLV